MQVVEYVEECVLCFGFACKFLYVVDDKYVDALVEIEEIVALIAQYGIGVLHLEEVCRDVEYAFFGIVLFYGKTDGVS